MPYLDAGAFYIIIFNEHKVIQKQNFENIVSIDHEAIINSNFVAPLINCFFFGESHIFVNLLNYETQKNVHFIYSITLKKNIEKPLENFVSNLNENFPMKLWHDVKHNEVYVFYRTGDCCKLPIHHNGEPEIKMATIGSHDPWSTIRQKLDIWEQLVDRAIEQIIVYKNKILIVKTCKDVQFFIQELDTEDQKIKWKRYHKLKVTGDISLQEGSQWLTVSVTGKYIQFYKFEKLNIIP